MVERGLFEEEIHGRKAREERAHSRGVSAPARVVALVRNVQRLPEVVVKVSGYAKTRSRAVANAGYITRRDKDVEDFPVELADGSVLTDPRAIDEVIDTWFAAREVRQDARRTVNIILSSPRASDPATVKDAVRGFARDFFANHDYLFVMHTDTPNPHAHLTVKMRGFDGRQLRLNKPELQDMRERYASALRERGIAVNASYRSDRGQWRKARSQALHHLDSKEGQKAVQESRVLTALKEKATRQKTTAPEAQPWRAAMQRRRDLMNAEYRGAAKYLRETHGERFADLAVALTAFGDQLPKPTTLLDEITVKLGKQGMSAPQQPGFEPDVER